MISWCLIHRLHTEPVLRNKRQRQIEMVNDADDDADMIQDAMRRIHSRRRAIPTTGNICYYYQRINNPCRVDHKFHTTPEFEFLPYF